MKTFSNKDIVDYYNQTETHYNMFWKLEKSLGIHYGVWDHNTKNIAEAVVNSNRSLMEFGGIQSNHKVLDAGCGVGGSSIFLAKTLGCSATGITLSKNQVSSANTFAKENKVDHLVNFIEMDYTNTDFPDNHFDIVWAVESFGSAHNKADFFKEMYRILKPGGKVLFTDTFKPKAYDISTNKDMQTMLNGWAIADILSLKEVESIGAENGFELEKIKDLSESVKKSVKRYYYAAYLGWLGTKVYNLFKNASHFSKIHYKTGFAQKRAYDKKDWGYYHISLIKK